MMLRKCKMQVEVMSLTRWSLNKIRTYQYGKGFFGWEMGINKKNKNSVSELNKRKHTVGP